jgi:hypothetical protein
MRRTSRGTVVGVAILLAGYLAWGVVLYTGTVTPALSLLFLLVPAIAGFASAWLAPRGQLAPSVMLAIPAACFAAILQLVLQKTGIDVGFFSGLQGALRTGAFTLLWAGLFCMVGGLLAVIARQVRGTA